jgi:hypothetical protein
MTKKIDLLKTRFELNMGRIASLTHLVLTEKVESLKPKSFWRYEGASADIFRLIVVFLHATVEMLVRGLLPQSNKKWCFYSGADLDIALSRSRLDPQLFKSLYPTLKQLAKRRKQIVHDGDLSAKDQSSIDHWSVADSWQMCMWNLAVLAFFYQLLIALGAADETETNKYANICAAMRRHAEGGKQLLDFAKISRDAPHEAKLELVQRYLKTLEDMLVLLRAEQRIAP